MHRLTAGFGGPESRSGELRNGDGEVVGGTIVYGDADSVPLLGVTALESGGFEVDPRAQELKRVPAVLL